MDWPLKKIFLKEQGFRGGSDEKMRRMWLGLGFVVVGLPPLTHHYEWCVFGTKQGLKIYRVTHKGWEFRDMTIEYLYCLFLYIYDSFQLQSFKLFFSWISLKVIFKAQDWINLGIVRFIEFLVVFTVTSFEGNPVRQWRPKRTCCDAKWINTNVEQTKATTTGWVIRFYLVWK